MPALLVEAGIIVNREDEPRLGAPACQRKFARVITQAVADFCASGMVQPWERDEHRGHAWIRNPRCRFGGEHAMCG